MDRPSLIRWLKALEKPHLYCPICNELTRGPDHSACVRMWAKMLRLAYPFDGNAPEDYEHDRRPEPVPCNVLSREARVNVLAARFHNNEQLWHPRDLCQMDDLDGVAIEVTRTINGSISEGEVLCG
jgi:hypothetical protein